MSANSDRGRLKGKHYEPKSNRNEDISPSIINFKRRCTYASVASILNQWRRSVITQPATIEIGVFLPPRKSQSTLDSLALLVQGNLLFQILLRLLRCSSAKRSIPSWLFLRSCSRVVVHGRVSMWRFTSAVANATLLSSFRSRMVTFLQSRRFDSVTACQMILLLILLRGRLKSIMR